jgi:hypothetical protein
MGAPDTVGPLGLRVGDTATRTKTVTEEDLRKYAGSPHPPRAAAASTRAV